MAKGDGVVVGVGVGRSGGSLVDGGHVIIIFVLIMAIPKEDDHHE